MTFYHQQILSLKNKFLLKDHLCEKIINAKRFIDENFSNRINLDAIATEACISKFHFLRLFKSLYGRTPHQHLTEIRIEKAKEFLRSGFSVADTCFLTGFESVSSFKALFKKSTRLAPSFYQKRSKL